MSRSMHTGGFTRAATLLLATWLVFVGVWSGPDAAATEEISARQILEATGVKGGLIVHLGCGDGKLTAALRANDSYVVHGLDTNTENVKKARGHIQSLGIYVVGFWGASGDPQCAVLWP